MSQVSCCVFMSKEERWALPLPGWTRTCRNDYVMMMMMMMMMIMMKKMMMMMMMMMWMLPLRALRQHESRGMSAL